MEDPITFDVWVVVAANKRVGARQLLANMRPNHSRLGLLGEIARGIAGHEAVLAMADVGWSVAQSCMSKVEAAGVASVYQSGYGPSDEQRLQRCPAHEVWFAGSLGCPVCDQRYEE